MTPTDEGRLWRALLAHQVRFVIIGVWGVNHYAEGSTEIFLTQDRDLFLPLEPENLLQAWEACEEAELELFAGARRRR
jgi:hypothetical protein